MKNILVMGAGRVGRVIVADLSSRYRVTAADRDPGALEAISEYADTADLDMTDPSAVGELVRPYDLIVSAVPGRLGFKLLTHLIEAGKDLVDISFFPENALDLHELAVSNKVTAVVDMGVAPGLSNLIAGYQDSRMEVAEFECLVGGLPVNRPFPFEYKAPFSPADVIEEYLRPARYRENGRSVTRPALSDPELVQFEEAGTLEAFNTDGLRSLLETLPHIPTMKEKTLRYPGHARWISGLKEAGFFDQQPVRVGEEEITPLEFTSRILQKEWKLGPEEEEFTIMRITISGRENGADKKITYTLFDRFDGKTGFSSMGRTTGFTCAAAVDLILEKSFTKKGISPPEIPGKDPACYHYVLNYLRDRGVTVRVDIET